MTTTEDLFRENSYLKECDAEITVVDERGVQFDRTVFYATGGGQPGDYGIMSLADGTDINVIDTIKDRETNEHIHVIKSPYTNKDTNPQNTPNLNPLIIKGAKVSLKIDWERRYSFMRMHSCLHMLCALVDAPVTGGSIQQDKGRLDFDLAESMDKEKLSAALNALITADHAMSTRWITDEELDANPELVRTLSAKPPRGSGRIRLVNFEGVDLQPCGGTHIASTAEIGKVRVSKIEKKGRQNRRISVVFEE